MTVLFGYTFPKDSTSPEGIPTPMLHKGVGPARVFLTPYEWVCRGLGCEVEERESETWRGRGRQDAGTSGLQGVALLLQYDCGVCLLSLCIKSKNMLRPNVFQVLEERLLFSES